MGSGLEALAIKTIFQDRFQIIHNELGEMSTFPSFKIMKGLYTLLYSFIYSCVNLTSKMLLQKSELNICATDVLALTLTFAWLI